MSKSLPVIDRPIDNTALDAYMKCPRMYFYSMVLSRRKRGAASALEFGSWWHAGLEAFFKEPVRELALARGVEAIRVAHTADPVSPDDHRTLKRCISAFLEYVEVVKDDGKITLGWPDAPIIESSVNFSLPDTPYSYAGKIDRIVRIGGHLFVEDHKSTSQLGSFFFSNFTISNQMMGYVWLGEQLTGERVAGVRINAFGLLKKENKFAREIISFSRERIEQWRKNTIRWIDKLDQSYDHMAANQTGDSEVDMTVIEDAWPMNFNQCFASKYGPCQYVSVCSQQPHRQLQVLESDYEHHPWNPLAAHGAEDDYGIAG